jgi:hypothetical protein
LTKEIVEFREIRIGDQRKGVSEVDSVRLK